MRIISILIRYCPHRYYQSYSCWPTASWCSWSPAQEKWWPQHCGQSSQCSGPQPESTGTSPRPGEWWGPGWGHSRSQTPPRSSSSRTWCWCSFPEDRKSQNEAPAELDQTNLSYQTVLTVQLPPSYFWQELL